MFNGIVLLLLVFSVNVSAGVIGTSQSDLKVAEMFAKMQTLSQVDMSLLQQDKMGNLLHQALVEIMSAPDFYSTFSSSNGSGYIAKWSFTTTEVLPTGSVPTDTTGNGGISYPLPEIDDGLHYPLPDNTDGHYTAVPEPNAVWLALLSLLVLSLRYPGTIIPIKHL